jgi:hypothetical protein
MKAFPEGRKRISPGFALIPVNLFGAPADARARRPSLAPTTLTMTGLA